jgi:hypothetical protein
MTIFVRHTFMMRKCGTADTSYRSARSSTSSASTCTTMMRMCTMLRVCEWRHNTQRIHYLTSCWACFAFVRMAAHPQEL